MGTRNNNWWTLTLTTNCWLSCIRIANVYDNCFNALVVKVTLTCWTLIALIRETTLVKVWKLCLNTLTNLNDGEIRSGLKNSTCDDVTNAATELIINLSTSGIAHKGLNLCLSMLCSNTAGIWRSYVYLVKLSVLTSLLIWLTLRDKLVDVDTASSPINGDTGAKIKMKDVSIAFCQRLLQTVQKIQLIDVLLLAKQHQSFHHFRCHE